MAPHRSDVAAGVAPRPFVAGSLDFPRTLLARVVQCAPRRPKSRSSYARSVWGNRSTCISASNMVSPATVS